MTPSQAIPQNIIDEFVGVAHGDFARLKALLEQYPILLNASATWNETAIQAATQMGRIDIVEYLLARGAPLDICTASMLGLADRVSAVLGADPSLSQATGAHGIPLLYFPVIRGQKAIAEMLLSRGAQVNAGAGGNTPLHGAVLFNRPEMVSWLLSHGANPSLLDYNGKTPLQLAEENKNEPIAGILRHHASAGK